MPKSSEPKCFFCKEKAYHADYCVGCDSYICADCDDDLSDNASDVSHKPTDHIEEDVYEEDDYPGEDYE